MNSEYTLYGMEASLYTARARSYMRMHGVPFKEVKPGGDEFMKEIVPKIGRWIIPVLKTPEGELVQDGADIIDLLDQRGFSKSPVYPSDPILRAIAHVFELYGCHGLLKHSMHYRWSFDSVNLPFITEMFRDGMPNGLTPEQREQAFLANSGKMRRAGAAAGVTDQSKATIEQSYTQFLSLLEKHLQETPFILGGHATLADYALIGSMYAHLGRDPVPLHLMQTQAPRVFRWTELLNTTETFEDELYSQHNGALFDSDQLPQTLLDILQFISSDYGPEIAAHVAHANDWLDEHPEVTEGTSTQDKVMARGMGRATFAWHGIEINSFVIPYRFYLLDRLIGSVESQEPAAREAIRAVFARTSLTDMLNLQTKRPVHRADNHEVWGALR